MGACQSTFEDHTIRLEMQEIEDAGNIDKQLAIDLPDR